MEKLPELKDVAMIVGLITGFIAMISIAVFYVYNLLHSGDFCSCTEQIPLIIIMVASAGIFVGSLTYYFLIDRVIGKINQKKGAKLALKTLAKLLEGDEKRVFEIIVDAKKLRQTDIVKKSGLSRVKVTRILQKFEMKGIIKRTSNGKAKYVELAESMGKFI